MSLIEYSHTPDGTAENPLPYTPQQLLSIYQRKVPIKYSSCGYKSEPYMGCDMIDTTLLPQDSLIVASQDKSVHCIYKKVWVDECHECNSKGKFLLDEGEHKQPLKSITCIKCDGLGGSFYRLVYIEDISERHISVDSIRKVLEGIKNRKKRVCEHQIKTEKVIQVCDVSGPHY